MKLEPPPHLAALLAAYVEVTGLPVMMSYERARALTDLHDRGMTADDVRAVVGKLKRRVQSGVKGYTDSSLDFRNALGNVDTFEERALKQRQEKARKAGAGAAVARSREVATTRPHPGGGTVTVFAAPGEKPIRPVDPAVVGKALREFADGLGGKS